MCLDLTKLRLYTWLRAFHKARRLEKYKLDPTITKEATRSKTRRRKRRRRDGERKSGHMEEKGEGEKEGE